MKIPLVDLVTQHAVLNREIDRALKQIIRSASFIKGPFVKEFEQQFAKYIGTKRAVGVASGTDALKLCLMALDIKPGDEVIMPVNTFVACAYAALSVGAKPVFVDIDPDTLNIDVDLIEAVINKKTRVIMPVHLYGQPAAMDKIIKLAKKHHLKVVEDVSQAQGAWYGKKRVGSLGDLSAVSLYPSKNLGACGDAGIITTNSNKLADRLLALREYGGHKSRYYYEEVGLNSRLDSIQAAILSIKLKHLDRWNTKRRKIAQHYSQHLLIKIPELVLLKINPQVTPVYYCYVIRANRRDALAKYLEDSGIQTAIHYPYPLHLHPALNYLGYKPGDFPIAEMTSKQILSLPMYPDLTTAQQDYIITAIGKFYDKN